MMLSVIIITHDRNDIILENTRIFDDIKCEYVIIDKDGTVYFQKSENINKNFSYLRNYGISKAKTDWILFIDSDELLSDEMIKQIPNLITSNSIDGYWFRRKTFIGSNRYLKYGLFYPDWQLRLFRNKRGYRYAGAVHEQLNIPYEKTRQVDADILHYPTHPKYTKFSDFKNMLPYVRIQAAELAKRKKTTVWYWQEGIRQFCLLFFGGFFRGKGFLDGWAGFRAHLMFATSIAYAYILAASKLTPSKK